MTIRFIRHLPSDAPGRHRSAAASRRGDGHRRGRARHVRGAFGSNAPTRLLVLALLHLLVGCTTPATVASRREASLAGLQIVYRFESGRTYRAAYAARTVDFELLEPPVSPPIRKTLPYSSRTLRDDLFLVVWNDPDFHTTFVVDLARRRVHASASREREGLFLGEARIIETTRRDRDPGSLPKR